VLAGRLQIEARTLVTESIFHGLLDATGATTKGARAALATRADDPRTAAALAGVRRRGEEAQRAATAGDLNILIGYDLRFWRELSNLFGNPYLADFLHRLRVQSWVCAVQHLRRLEDLRGHLWAGHTDLVDALTRRDAPAAHDIVAAYNTHSLTLIEVLSQG
jgi:DNA-binding GntR family transcriptional regulator